MKKFYSILMTMVLVLVMSQGAAFAASSYAPEVDEISQGDDYIFVANPTVDKVGSENFSKYTKLIVYKNDKEKAILTKKYNYNQEAYWECNYGPASHEFGIGNDGKININSDFIFPFSEGDKLTFKFVDSNNETTVLGKETVVTVKAAKPHTPAKPINEKVKVKDVNHLTDKEKEAVMDAIREANAGNDSILGLTIDDNGDATVHFKNGKSQVLTDNVVAEEVEVTPAPEPAPAPAPGEGNGNNVVEKPVTVNTGDVENMAAMTVIMTLAGVALFVAARQRKNNK